MNSKEFSDSKEFSKLQDCSNANEFSNSKDLSNSGDFSHSQDFSNSAGCSHPADFSNSKVFSTYGFLEPSGLFRSLRMSRILRIPNFKKRKHRAILRL